MPFEFDLSERLKDILTKIYKKDRPLYDAVWKKIREIVSRDPTTIDFYKNLRHGLSDSKRVHIQRNYVLLFKVRKNENHILFDDLDHHDHAYAR